MKKLLAAFCLSGALLGAAQAAPVVVSLVPSANQIAIGEFTTVEMRISGLDAEILSSFDVDTLFDASVLANTSVTWSSFFEMGGPNAQWDVSFGAGVTDVVAYSLLDDAALAASQSDSFTVLSFAFRGVADGSSLINLGSDLDFERNFVGLDGASLDVTVNGTCVAVGNGSCAQRVPEPASLALLGLASLSGLWAARRRRARLAT